VLPPLSPLNTAMAAKKQQEVDIKKRKRIDTKTPSNPKKSTTKFVPSKKPKSHSDDKDKNKTPLNARERRHHAKVTHLCNFAIPNHFFLNRLIRIMIL